MHRAHTLSITLLGFALLGCGGGDESGSGESGGTGGSAGAGAGGVGGASGSGGTAASGGAGTGGIGATGGVAGSGGAAGSGGTAGGGTGGTAGAAGGTGGTAGAGGGMGGAAGSGGTGGTTGGTGGTGGGFAAACYCGTCHTVPPAGNIAHAAQYVASTSLATAGHHGDVVFSAPATGMIWNVNATQGAPVTARGTCTGACHSDGRGGPPNVTPYWAGGSWNAGSCASCHDATMNNLTNRHPKHDGEGPCSMCHPPANSATHMNGSWNVNSTVNGPQGGSITTTPPGSGNPCGQNYVCNGTCHGHTHTNDCWN